jgi:hypothetical protein
MGVVRKECSGLYGGSGRRDLALDRHSRIVAGVQLDADKDDLEVFLVQFEVCMVCRVTYLGNDLLRFAKFFAHSQDPWKLMWGLF